MAVARPRLRPGVVRKVDDNRRCRATHDNPSKRLQFRRVDFHMPQEGGDMNEIAGLGARDGFAFGAPAYFADAGQDVSDRLLLAVMVNSCTLSWFDLEQTAPHCRSDAQRR